MAGTRLVDQLRSHPPKVYRGEWPDALAELDKVQHQLYAPKHVRSTRLISMAALLPRRHVRAMKADPVQLQERHGVEPCPSMMDLM